MKKASLSALAAAAALIAGGGTCFAAELPTYQVTGFPISPVQAQVLGAANVHEQSRAPTSEVSPHQLNVPAPRKKVAAATDAPVQTETDNSIR
jgi:hypothetical protein